MIPFFRFPNTLFEYQFHVKNFIKRAKRVIYLETSRIMESVIHPVMRFDDVSFKAKTAISKQHRYVYYRIPKAANSTIVYSLYAFECGVSVNVPQNLRFVKDTYFTQPSELSREDEVTMQESWFKFTIVRNPYARIISAYRDKIVVAGEKPQYVNRFLGRLLDCPISFDQFLYYLERGGIKLNPHWTPQSILLPGGVDALDYWGKLESLETDFLHISTSIYGQPVPLRFVSHRKTGSTSSDPLLTAAYKKRIYRLYQSDFDIFSYPI